jgi:hypothetical protein
MATNNHNANHERPPAQKDRRSVLGENLLTVVTIIGVIGKKRLMDAGWESHDFVFFRWYNIRTYLKKLRQ